MRVRVRVRVGVEGGGGVRFGDGAWVRDGVRSGLGLGSGVKQRESGRD